MYFDLDLSLTVFLGLIHTEVREPDEDSMHDLLHGIDHEEPGQHQDLRHRETRVGERALSDGCRGDLDRILI